MSHRFAVAFTVAALLWAAALVATPLALARETFVKPAATVYATSSRICHQRAERSFHISGIQLPVCARCFGLYAAGALGVLLAWGNRRVPADRARIGLLLSAIPTIVTWSLEAAGFVTFSNEARAVAAVPLGASAGWLFVQMLRYDFLLNGQNDDRGSGVRNG